MTATRNIVLIKHGETRENVQGIHQGRGIGGTLSADGARDVDVTGRGLGTAGIVPERLLYSPRSRCRQSADILHAHFPGAVLREETRLDAKNSGHLSGLPREAAAQEAADRDVPIHQLRAPGGESSEDVQARYVALLRTIGDEQPGTTVLVGHGGGLACLLLWLTGNGFDRYWDHVPGSGAATLIEMDGNGPHLTLVKVAPTALGEALTSRAAS